MIYPHLMFKMDHLSPTKVPSVTYQSASSIISLNSINSRIYCSNIFPYIIFDKVGTKDIERKSLKIVRFSFLGMKVMFTCFHFNGKYDFLMHKFNTCACGFETNGQYLNNLYKCFSFYVFNYIGCSTSHT